MSETKPTSDPKPKTDEAAPTDEQIAGTVGAHVVLPPDSKAAQGARGVFPTLQEHRPPRCGVGGDGPRSGRPKRLRA